MPKLTMAGFILKNKTSHFLYITKKHFFGALLYMFPLSTIVKFTDLNIFSGFFWFFLCLGVTMLPFFGWQLNLGDFRSGWLLKKKGSLS
ncbi:hypothetical protein BJY52DRAFT_1345292, partial [Lactarius psammicola]